MTFIPKLHYYFIHIHNFKHGKLRVSSVCKKRDSFKAEKYVQ